MSSKPNSLTMARSAILTHSAVFSPHWGETEQSENGIVQFDALPAGIESLIVEPEFRKRWMGGTCVMNIKLSQAINSSDIGELKFKGARGGHFSGKTGGQFSEDLLNALNADTKLKDTLRSIDLEKLTINIKDGCVETVLTPYGGGIVYLIIPPMRSVIPLPPEQTDNIAWAIERIASFI